MMMEAIGSSLVLVGAINAVRAHVRQHLGEPATPGLWSGLALLGAVVLGVA